MYPAQSIIKSLTALPDDYLAVVVPIIGASALDICGCESYDTETVYTIESVLAKVVTLNEVITANSIGQYFDIEGKIYYCTAQAEVSSKTTLTMDEDVIYSAIDGKCTLLAIPDGLTLAVANECLRYSTSGVDSESAGNASVSYGKKGGAEFEKEVGKVAGCCIETKGLVFI